MSNFELGQVVVTRALMEHANNSGINLAQYVARHVRGDWGDVCASDKHLNDEAARTGQRILSRYKLPSGQDIYCNTEWDRSYTTLMFCEEY